MADIKYAISVLVNGQHSVNIEADDPIIASRALEWLSQTYRVSPAPKRADEGAAPQLPLQVAPQQEAQPPICGIHHQPMKLMHGKRGQFWSCHEKMQGPTGCQDCHKRTKEGDAFYNSGAFAPKDKAAKGGHGGH